LKDVDPKVFTRILRKDGRTDGRKEGRTDGSITISIRNFVGEGMKRDATLKPPAVINIIIPAGMIMLMTGGFL
jgi:hypothetical protein